MARRVDIVAMKERLALTSGMASRLGAPLGERAISGEIDASRLAALVNLCLECTQPARCRVWQEMQREPANNAPDFCLNAAAFGPIKARV